MQQFGEVTFSLTLSTGNIVTLRREIKGRTTLEALRDSIEHLEELALENVENDEEHVSVSIELDGRWL